MAEKVLNTTLAEVAGGAAEELFQRELRRVGENLLDPNTEPKKKRSITIKFEFSMDARRSDVTVDISATSKLQAPLGATTHFQVTTDRRSGVLMHEPEMLPFDEGDVVKN